MCENRMSISNDELISKLHRCAMDVTPEMAFYLGVASGRIRWLAQKNADLEAQIEKISQNTEENNG